MSVLPGNTQPELIGHGGQGGDAPVIGETKGTCPQTGVEICRETKATEDTDSCPEQKPEHVLLESSQAGDTVCVHTPQTERSTDLVEHAAEGVDDKTVFERDVAESCITSQAYKESDSETETAEAADNANMQLDHEASDADESFDTVIRMYPYPKPHASDQSHDSQTGDTTKVHEDKADLNAFQTEHSQGNEERPNSVAMYPDEELESEDNEALQNEELQNLYDEEEELPNEVYIVYPDEDTELFETSVSSDSCTKYITEREAYNSFEAGPEQENSIGFRPFSVNRNNVDTENQRTTSSDGTETCLAVERIKVNPSVSPQDPYLIIKDIKDHRSPASVTSSMSIDLCSVSSLSISDGVVEYQSAATSPASQEDMDSFCEAAAVTAEALSNSYAAEAQGQKGSHGYIDQYDMDYYYDDEDDDDDAYDNEDLDNIDSDIPYGCDYNSDDDEDKQVDEDVNAILGDGDMKELDDNIEDEHDDESDGKTNNLPVDDETFVTPRTDEASPKTIAMTLHKQTLDAYNLDIDNTQDDELVEIFNKYYAQEVIPSQAEETANALEALVRRTSDEHYTAPSVTQSDSAVARYYAQKDMPSQKEARTNVLEVLATERYTAPNVLQTDEQVVDQFDEVPITEAISASAEDTLDQLNNNNKHGTDENAQDQAPAQHHTEAKHSQDNNTNSGNNQHRQNSACVSQDTNPGKDSQGHNAAGSQEADAEDSRMLRSALSVNTLFQILADMCANLPVEKASDTESEEVRRLHRGVLFGTTDNEDDKSSTGSISNTSVVNSATCMAELLGGLSSSSSCVQLQQLDNGERGIDSGPVKHAAVTATEVMNSYQNAATASTSGECIIRSSISDNFADDEVEHSEGEKTPDQNSSMESFKSSLETQSKDGHEHSTDQDNDVTLLSADVADCGYGIVSKHHQNHATQGVGAAKGDCGPLSDTFAHTGADVSPISARTQSDEEKFASCSESVGHIPKDTHADTHYHHVPFLEDELHQSGKCSSTSMGSVSSSRRTIICYEKEIQCDLQPGCSIQDVLQRNPRSRTPGISKSTGEIVYDRNVVEENRLHTISMSADQPIDNLLKFVGQSNVALFRPTTPDIGDTAVSNRMADDDFSDGQEMETSSMHQKQSKGISNRGINQRMMVTLKELHTELMEWSEAQRSRQRGQRSEEEDTVGHQIAEVLPYLRRYCRDKNNRDFAPADTRSPSRTDHSTLRSEPFKLSMMPFLMDQWPSSPVIVVILMDMGLSVLFNVF